MIYTPEQSEKILSTIMSISLANNGWAFIGEESWLHEAVKAAGYQVMKSMDFHGNPAWKGAQIRAPRPVFTKPTVNCCPKCNGEGRISHYQHIKSGECFLCNGTGIYVNRAA